MILNKLFHSLTCRPRTWFLTKFNKKYVEESIKRRKGYCSEKCGACCFGRLIPCEYFNFKTNHCAIYGSPKWKKDCDTPSYPFDFKQLSPSARKKCTYYWVDGKESD